MAPAQQEPISPRMRQPQRPRRKVFFRRGRWGCRAVPAGTQMVSRPWCVNLRSGAHFFEYRMKHFFVEYFDNPLQSTQMCGIIGLDTDILLYNRELPIQNDRSDLSFKAMVYHMEDGVLKKIK